jgi:hypothetical protein
MKFKGIYDNKGKTFDRFTIIFDDGTALGLSHNPDSPVGFSQWGESVAEGVDLGKPITFQELPLRVQEHIKIRTARERR